MLLVYLVGEVELHELDPLKALSLLLCLVELLVLSLKAAAALLLLDLQEGVEEDHVEDLLLAVQVDLLLVVLVDLLELV